MLRLHHLVKDLLIPAPLGAGRMKIMWLESIYYRMEKMQMKKLP
jgi:hypothetical protein